MKLIEIKNIQDLRQTLQQLNKKEKGVIVNLTSVLRDLETQKLRYTDYITKMLLAVNIKHVDLGFYKSLYNESIVLDWDVTEVAALLKTRNYVSREVVSGYKVFIKPNRLRKRDVPYVNAFPMIDGILEQ